METKDLFKRAQKNWLIWSKLLSIPYKDDSIEEKRRHVRAEIIAEKLKNFILDDEVEYFIRKRNNPS
jgi:hypothetical protein